MKESKLPTEWDLLNNIWHIINQQVEEEILLSSEVQYEIEKHIESHTQAHTEGLRERVKELEAELNDVKFRFKTAIQGLRSANEIIKKINNEA